MRDLFTYNKSNFFQWRSTIQGEGAICISIIEYLRIINDLPSDDMYVDLSSIHRIQKDNPALFFQLEKCIAEAPDQVFFVCDSDRAREMQYDFRYYFAEIESPEDSEQIENQEKSPKPAAKKVTRIVDLNETELSCFLRIFSQKLYGHTKFKDSLPSIINSFRVFNKIGEHKVLSLFLMGDSGVGKTEVARCIHKALESNTKMAKINFGNYSSHDSLNSLIGSPRGYIGSDSGELFQKVQNSDIGLILIDEFEKAALPVYNYFLDVLENGKMTNSQGEEIDVDGYIIIFTSNVSKDNFNYQFSPELRSRFDYIGIFDLLTEEDKRKYVQFRISSIVGKYEDSMKCKLNTALCTQISAEIDVSKYNNMRDLNKKIKDSFVRQVLPHFQKSTS